MFMHKAHVQVLLFCCITRRLLYFNKIMMIIKRTNIPNTAPIMPPTIAPSLSPVDELPDKRYIHMSIIKILIVLDLCLLLCFLVLISEAESFRSADGLLATRATAFKSLS